MRPVVYQDPAEVVADIPDGASIFIGGFGPLGYPFTLLEELYKGTARNLTVITNAGATLGRRGPIDLVHFHDQGRIGKYISVATGAGHASRLSEVERLYRAGKIEVEAVPQGTLAERIRAGGAGIPAFYTPTGVGTEIEEGKECREFDGKYYLLERALTADYALIHAYKADTYGNLFYRLSSRNFNPIMAMAARTTIVEVEEPIGPPGSLAPDEIHTPGLYVHRLVQIPEGRTKKINIRLLKEQVLAARRTGREE